MDRRNEKIRADQAYWIRPENSSKGYSVYSKRQLDKLIEEGKITDNDRVQIRVSKGI